MTTPILAFANYTKPFLLETDASKDRLGAALSQKQMDGQYHPVGYSRRALMPQEHMPLNLGFGTEVGSY